MAQIEVAVPHFAHLIPKICALLLSIPLLAAYFLFEDSQGKIQSRLETWWVHLDEARGTATSLVTGFTKAAARSSGRLLDAAFGTKLFSVRAVAASVSFSLASAALLVMFVVATGLSHPTHQVSIVSNVGLLFWLLSLAVFAVLSDGSEIRIRSISIPLAWVWYFAIVESIVKPIAWVVSLIGEKWGRVPAIHTVEGLTGLLLFSFLCDATCIAALRRVFRFVAICKSLPRIASLLLLNLFLAIAFFFAPFLLGIFIFLHWQALKIPGEYLMFVGFALNTIDVVVCLFFFALALFLIGHHVLWPAVGHLLYALQGFGIVKRRKQFAVAGAILMCYALGLSDKVWILIQALI